MQNIKMNSSIIVLSQGCLILPTEIKDILKGVVASISSYSDWQRVNLIIACKGSCSLPSAVINNNDQTFSLKLVVPVEVNVAGGITQESEEDVKWVVGLVVGIIALVLGVILVKAYAHKREELKEEKELKDRLNQEDVQGAQA